MPRADRQHVRPAPYPAQASARDARALRRDLVRMEEERRAVLAAARAHKTQAHVADAAAFFVAMGGQEACDGALDLLPSDDALALTAGQSEEERADCTALAALLDDRGLLLAAVEACLRRKTEEIKEEMGSTPLHREAAPSANRAHLAKRSTADLLRFSVNALQPTVRLASHPRLVRLMSDDGSALHPFAYHMRAARETLGFFMWTYFNMWSLDSALCDDELEARAEELLRAGVDPCKTAERLAAAAEDRGRDSIFWATGCSCWCADDYDRKVIALAIARHERLSGARVC